MALQKIPFNHNSIQNESEKIRRFLTFSDSTTLEKKMVEDWIARLSHVSPQKQAEQWTNAQGDIRRLLSEKQEQGECLEKFKNTNSGWDPNDEPISGRMMYRALEWKTWEILQMPLTENCNLLCRHCTRTRKFIEKHISFDEFKTNLAKFSPFQFGESSSISYGVTLGDFSGNGKLDIIVSNSGSRNIVYYNQSK